MKRREHLAWLGAGLALPALAQAQFQEGKHYTRLKQPIPASGSQVEVVEFFWYGCPACNALEPTLQAWAQRLPNWVAFRHQHVLLREQTRPHQQLWFTLTAMGVEHRFRQAIFAALHVHHNPLDTPQAMLKLLGPLGLDEAKFTATWKSFDAKSFGGARITAANRLIGEGYRVHGVPTLAIGGRFIVSAADAAGGRAEQPFGASALRLADQLLSTLKPA